MEIDGSAVVAQTRPGADHVCDRRLRARRRRREALEEAVVLGDDARHLGLLEHDLTDEDRPRVTRVAPRQVSPRARRPTQERLLHQNTSVLYGSTNGSCIPSTALMPRATTSSRSAGSIAAM